MAFLAAWIALAVSSSLPACGSPLKSDFQLTQESFQHRAAQTRYFETDDELELLSASAAVLQDMGFHIDESVPDLGFLLGGKERSAREYGEEIGRTILSALTLGLTMMPADLHQKFGATLVTRPLDVDGSRHEARITFYRVIWAGEGYFYDETLPPGSSRAEVLRDPGLYQQFFERLSKSVFLEAYTL
jgi:hypothetical protein